MDKDAPPGAAEWATLELEGIKALVCAPGQLPAASAAAWALQLQGVACRAFDDQADAAAWLADQLALRAADVRWLSAQAWPAAGRASIPSDGAG